MLPLEKRELLRTGSNPSGPLPEMLLLFPYLVSRASFPFPLSCPPPATLIFPRARENKSKGHAKEPWHMHQARAAANRRYDTAATCCSQCCVGFPSCQSSSPAMQLVLPRGSGEYSFKYFYSFLTWLLRMRQLKGNTEVLAVSIQTSYSVSRVHRSSHQLPPTSFSFPHTTSPVV